MSHLPPLPPSTLQGDQAAFYDELTNLVDTYFGNRFTTKDASTQAFTGPFGIYMHTPTVGRPFFAQMVALSRLAPGRLTARAREVAILTVGAHFGAAYELYSHRRVAGGVGVDARVIDAVCRGGEVSFGDGGEEEEERVAFEVARVLVTGKGGLSTELYRRAQRVLGEDGVLALVHFVAFYAATCVLLNGFAVQVPED